jgi:hypothetical protein
MSLEIKKVISILILSGNNIDILYQGNHCGSTFQGFSYLVLTDREKRSDKFFSLRALNYVCTLFLLLLNKDDVKNRLIFYSIEHMQMEKMKCFILLIIFNYCVSFY